MAKIYVILEGGLCQGVVSHDPAMQGIEFAVVDYDADGADDIVEVRQGDGSVVNALVWGDVIGKAEIEVC